MNFLASKTLKMACFDQKTTKYDPKNQISNPKHDISPKPPCTDDVFYFNVPRNVCTKDGRKSTVCFSIVEMEDGTLAIEKVEKWMVKNKAMSAKILMFVDGKDQMVTRMECDGIVVNRVHKRF